MVVQHILCSRMGKREVKPAILPDIKSETTPAETNENVTEDVTPSETNNTTEEKEDKEAEEPEKEPLVESTDNKEENNENDKDVTTETCDAENETKSDSDKQEEKVADSKTSENNSVAEAKPQMIEVEEYFVKYRNFSYLHCEWRTEEELYKGDKRIQAKLKRFKQRQQQNTNIFENVSISTNIKRNNVGINYCIY